MSRKRKLLLYTLLLVVLIISVVAATAIGAVAIPRLRRCASLFPA